jgi:hypothetical protein
VIFRKRSPAFRYIFFVHISTPLNITKKDVAAIGAKIYFSVLFEDFKTLKIIELASLAPKTKKISEKNV